MTATTSNTTSRLDIALERAVRLGQVAFLRVEDHANKMLRALYTLEGALGQLDVNAADLAELRSAIQTLVTKQASELHSALELRRNTLGRFRIALFGRTHIGKSTLIEAIVHGDGDSASRGATGFTARTKVHTWGSFDVEDTPGIETFGRVGEEHEEIARAAIRAADLVLLAFDDSNQKDTEFQKIGVWVSEYKKPCIAIVNVKNTGWRRPDKLPRHQQRIQPQLSVVQTANHVRQRLTALGFQEPVVVAVHAQNALFARAKDPYAHEATAKQRQTLLTRLGKEELLRASNFHRLEDLIHAMVEAGGAELRVGALEGDISGSATISRDFLRRERERFDKIADTLTRQATEAVRLTGADVLPKGMAEKILGLKCPSGTSEIERYSQDLIAAHIGGLEARAIGRARVAAAAEESMSDKELRKRAFPDDELNGAVNTVKEALQTHVRERLASARAELSADLCALVEEMSRELSGQGGRGKFWAGVALGLTSVAGAIAAVIIAPEALVAGVIAAGLMGLGWIRRKLFKAAEADRAKARQQNIERAEKFVRDAITILKKEIRNSMESLRHQLAEGYTIPLLRRLEAFQAAGMAIDDALTAVSAVVVRMKRTTAPDAVAARAAAGVTATAPKGIDQRSWTLLGGDWLDAAIDHERTSNILPKPRLSRLPALSTPSPTDLHALESRIARIPSEDTEALHSTIENARHWANSLARIVVPAGEYSSCKTTLSKRLHVIEGLPIPSDIAIEAGPTTAQVQKYPLGSGVLLIDTPGLQGGTANHDTLGFNAAACAPLVLFTINPQGITAEAPLTRAILAGDAKRGLPAGRNRSILTLQRADALGACPVDDEQAWKTTIATKLAEMSRMLDEWGVDAKPVFVVAADPFQRVGARTDATPADYEGTEKWDGFDELHAELEKQLSAQTRTHLVGAGIRCLSLACAERSAALLSEADHNNRIATLETQFTEIWETGAKRILALRGGTEGRVRTILTGCAAADRTKILTAETPEKLNEAVKAAAKWPEKAKPALEQLDGELSKAANDIATDLGERLEKRLDSPLARLVLSGMGERALKMKVASTGGPPKDASRVADGAAEGLGQLATKFSQDPKILREEIKAFFGVTKKWKPWEATKLAEKLGSWAPQIAKLGKILALLGPIMEVWSFYSDVKNRKKLEEGRQEAAKEIDAIVEELARSVLSGEDGLVASVNTLAKLYDDHAETHRERAQLARQNSAALRARAATLSTICVTSEDQ